MTVALDIPALIAHLSGSDLFGLIASLLAVGYLLYALLRGERL
jgi:hypothetical protein